MIKKNTPEEVSIILLIASYSIYILSSHKILESFSFATGNVMDSFNFTLGKIGVYVATLIIPLLIGILYVILSFYKGKNNIFCLNTIAYFLAENLMCVFIITVLRNILPIEISELINTVKHTPTASYLIKKEPVMLILAAAMPLTVILLPIASGFLTKIIYNMPRVKEKE